MQTSAIPTIPVTSSEVLTLIRRAQIRTTPTRTPSPPVHLDRRKHKRDTRRSPTLASSSSTTAMGRGTTINNKLRGSSQRRRRRSLLRTLLSSTHSSRHSNNRQRHVPWRIQSRRANPQGVGQGPQRYHHISVLQWRRNLQELRRQQDRETTTIPDISKLLGHVDTPNGVYFFLFFRFFIYVRCLSYRGLTLPLLFLIAHRFCDIV